MYEYISGRVAELAPTYAVIDVGGVGYYLNISLQTYTEIEHAEQAQLYVHHIVREDAQLLYGFASKVERELFRLLLGVSGVGGNTARMILSTYSPRELQGIIGSGNAVLLKNVKGLGLKTAQKIIVELSGKLTGLDTSQAVPAGPDDQTCDEALAALMRLCARAERSTGDALRLMQRWGLSEGDRQQVLQRLVRDRFIDDARYAEAFVRDKLRLSGWGEYKIRAALLRKGIARATIDAALCQTDREAMGRRLEEQLRRKMRSLKGGTPFERRNKLLRYGLSLGYDYETVGDLVATLIKENDECDIF